MAGSPYPGSAAKEIAASLVGSWVGTAELDSARTGAGTEARQGFGLEFESAAEIAAEQDWARRVAGAVLKISPGIRLPWTCLQILASAALRPRLPQFVAASMEWHLLPVEPEE